jgi:hypothetical protein
MLICFLMVVLVPGVSVIGNDLPADKVERVRTGMTLLGAIFGFGGGIATGLSLVPAGTPISESFLVAIPVAAVAMVTGALASRWIAEMTLARQPSLLFSPLLGAGLGFAGCAVVGGITFALAAAIAIPTVAAPEGYWGIFNYPQAVGMGFLAGAFWMGLAGIPIGGVIVPIISLYVGF